MYICGVLINAHSLMTVHTSYITKHIMNVKQRIQNIANIIMLIKTILHYSGVLSNVQLIHITVLMVA